MKRRFQAVKGTRDILPPESALWNRVESTARQVFAAYNFHEIRPPIFEHTYLFERSIGVETDIVSKEIYSFEDHRETELAALRDVICSWPVNIHRLAELENFQYLLARFLKHLEASVQDGTVGRTGIILAAQEALSKNHGELLDIMRGVGIPAAEQDRQQLMHLIEKIQIEAATVSLGDHLTLRPEATAQVCRAYIEHGMHTWPSPVKLYYLGPMFRRERPQKGRFRQFYQIGAEVLGPSDHPVIDAEVIELVMVFLERCGLKGATLYVNSIGCGECRPKYVERLRQELQKVKDKLGPDSQRRIETNPLRVLDSKLEDEQPIIEKLPSILDHLCDACRQHFAKVQQELKDRGLAYEINWRLVRGLDYYMRTTFEITAPGLGAQNAVCGGGRYDGLVELLGGQPTKGIGWALGTDRLVLALQQTEAGKAAPQVDAFVVWLGEAAYARARELARRLRDAGASVEIPYEEMKIKKALGRADQLMARYAVILGEDELKAGVFTLRDMHSGSQRAVSESELVKELKQPQMNTDEHR